MDEQLLVGVVAGVDLVVELNVVEVNELTDSLMNGDVAVVSVEFVLEVRSLRTVGDDFVDGPLIHGGILTIVLDTLLGYSVWTSLDQFTPIATHTNKRTKQIFVTDWK